MFNRNGSNNGNGSANGVHKDTAVIARNGNGHKPDAAICLRVTSTVVTCTVGSVLSVQEVMVAATSNIPSRMPARRRVRVSDLIAVFPGCDGLVVVHAALFTLHSTVIFYNDDRSLDDTGLRDGKVRTGRACCTQLPPYPNVADCDCSYALTMETLEALRRLGKCRITLFGRHFVCSEGECFCNSWILWSQTKVASLHFHRLGVGYRMLMKAGARRANF